MAILQLCSHRFGGTHPGLSKLPLLCNICMNLFIQYSLYCELSEQYSHIHVCISLIVSIFSDVAAVALVREIVAMEIMQRR